MSKAKAPQTAAADDPVELSNTPEAEAALETDNELSQVAALKALADDRARKITALERERDALLRDRGEPTLSSASTGTVGGTIRVKGVDIVTAPEHLLLVRLEGDHEQLETLRQQIARSLVKLEAESPETVEVETGRIGPELLAAIQNQP